MAIPTKFHLSFSYEGQNFEIDLKQGKKAKYQVEIGGAKYAVLGKKGELKKAYEVLIMSPLKDITTIAALKKTLKKQNVNFAKSAHNVGTEVLLTRSQVKSKRVEEAYHDFAKKLDDYAEKNVGKGALLVQVIGIKGAEAPKTYGQLSATDSTPVDSETIGRTGSGCKLWASLLSKILCKKYSKFIKMSDKLEKFAPNEALRKFGRFENGHEVLASDLAKEMTVEAQLAMTAGLEYEDKPPKEGSDLTLDEYMRGSEIPDGTIRFVYDPRDKISFYTNNICLVAYPLEKAYKKVLVAEQIEKGALKESQTLRELSEKIEPHRAKFKQKIEEAEKRLERLIARKERTHDRELNGQIEKLKREIDTFKRQALPFPQAVLEYTLHDLLASDSAYIENVYLYDLLDQILMPFDLHEFAYDDIMKRELLEPLGMTHSGFYGTEGTEMQVTFMNAKTEEEASKDPPHESVLTHASGFGRTNLEDAAKLARALLHQKGLVAGSTVLLTKDELLDVTRSHSLNNKNWGLGACITAMDGACFEKGGSLDQDLYSFAVDRISGVGLIVMTNCDKRPAHLIEEFQTQVRKIYHPKTLNPPRTEGAPPFPDVEHYVSHPLKKPKEYYEAAVGKVSLLFDWDKDKKGIMHWSGTPFEVEKQKDGTFRIITPGNFENLVVAKLQGAHTKESYLAIGDLSFIQRDVKAIPTDEEIVAAQKLFPKFAGEYTNPDKPEWGVFRFDVAGPPEKPLLRACFVENKGQKKTLIPQGIVKVEREKTHPHKVKAISFSGHGVFEIPDKILCFVLDPQKNEWMLEVRDLFSGTAGKPIETRSKD